MKFIFAILIGCLFLVQFEAYGEEIYQDVEGISKAEDEERYELKKQENIEQEGIVKEEEFVDNNVVPEKEDNEDALDIIDDREQTNTENDFEVSDSFLGEQSDINNLGLDCTFEQNFCAWTQSSADQFDWTRRNGPTSSSNTGPSVDHTRGNSLGYYIYIETSSPRVLNQAARLVSPELPRAPYGVCLSFWYHMYGRTINRLSVYANTQRVWTLSGNQGNRWISGKVTIRSNVTFNITFEGLAGSSYTGDIAIDDVNVTYGACDNQAVSTTRRPFPTTATVAISTTRRPFTTAQAVYPIRLVNGGSPNQGRVEIYYNGRWGTVCDDSWDINDANVVCRQLGLPPATSAQCCARFGRGSGPTWMDEVRCRGSERSLSQCSFNGWGREDCSHSEDAGVVCGTAVTTTARPHHNTTTPAVCGGLYCYNGGSRYCIRGRPYCYCRSGYTGRQCQTAVCGGLYCYNGGSRYCRNGRPYCYCRPGYTGRQCQNAVCGGLYCYNGGSRYCRNGRPYCYCRPGYTGRQCQNAVCGGLYCYNGGLRYCRNGRPYCRCRRGYYGRQCQYRVRPHTTYRPHTTRRPRNEILRILLKMLKGITTLLDAIKDGIKAGISRSGAIRYKREVTRMLGQMESNTQSIQDFNDPQAVNIKTDVKQIRKRAQFLLKQLDEISEKK